MTWTWRKKKKKKFNFLNKNFCIKVCLWIISFCWTAYRSHCGRTSLLLKTYGSTNRRSRMLLWTSYLFGSISTNPLERSSVLKTVLLDSTLVDVYKTGFSNDIFSIKGFPSTPIGDRVSVDSVAKTNIQG